MPVLWSPESNHAKELSKWEQRPTQLVSAEMIAASGGKLFTYQEYPKALYRAKRATGGPTIDGYIEAQSAADEARLLGQGWSVTQEAAIEHIHAADRDIAQAAAERAFADRKMTALAQIEAQRADDATPAHVPEVPRTPIKRSYTRRTPKEQS